MDSDDYSDTLVSSMPDGQDETNNHEG